jgi:enoyl-CoA hydratase
LLSRAPDELVTHPGLTSDRTEAAEAIYCGFSDHWVPADRRIDLLAALAVSDAGEALAELAVPVPHQSTLAGRRAWVDACYSADTVEKILDRLNNHGSDAARAGCWSTGATLPTALKVRLRALPEQETMRRGDSLERELRIAVRSLSGHDFPEGIRAQGRPRSQANPASDSLAEVSEPTSTPTSPLSGSINCAFRDPD